MLLVQPKIFFSNSRTVTATNIPVDNGLKAASAQVLTMEGDYDRFKVLLKRRLHESGWTDQIRVVARDIIKEKGGNVTGEKLFDELAPKGRAMVPTTIKKELLQKVKEDLLKVSGYYSTENIQETKTASV